jgi:hypothetical protein
VYATAQHLRRLTEFHSVDDLLAFTNQKPIKTVQPEVVEGGTGLRVFIKPEIADSW